MAFPQYNSLKNAAQLHRLSRVLKLLSDVEQNALSIKDDVVEKMVRIGMT